MAPQVGAYCLEKVTGGCGVLLGGVPDMPLAMCSSSAAAWLGPMPR